MGAFFDAILTAPTAIYTVLLGVLVAYWGLVIAGALDIEVLDVGSSVGDGDAFGAEAMLDALGVGGIPLTVLGSVWILGAWIASVALVEFVAPAAFWSSALIFIGSSLAGFALARTVLRPFRSAFTTHPAKERRMLVGKVGEVTSMRVDGRAGTARVDDGADAFEVHVRCPESNTLTRGSRVLVIDYDPRQELYRVVAADEALPTELFDDDPDGL